MYNGALSDVHQGWGQVQLTKYSRTLSTQNIYQVQVLVKYSFFQKLLKYIKYFHIKYKYKYSYKIFHWSLISIPLYIHNVCSVDKRRGPSPDYFFILKSGWLDILYDTEQNKFWMDKIKGLYPNHVFVQKSRQSYSMQNRF